MGRFQLNFRDFQLVSRAFLRTSQQYKLYYLRVLGLNSDNQFGLSFADHRYVAAVRWYPNQLKHFSCIGRVTDSFELNLPEIRRLNQLLDVRHLYLLPYRVEQAAEFSDLCDIFNGTLP